MRTALDCSISNDRDEWARLGIKVVSSATSILLKEKGSLREIPDCAEIGPAIPANLPALLGPAHARTPFLRIPPFPGGRLNHFIKVQSERVDPRAAAAAVRELRVGGTYWAAQPELPTGHVLVRSSAALDVAKGLLPGRPIVLWDVTAKAGADLEAASIIVGDCDPWHMLCGASALVTEVDDEVRLIASLLDISCYDFDCARGTAEPASLDAVNLIGEVLSGLENPFTGRAMNPLEAIELCGFWRRLIDSNRGIAGGIGFAFWKQSHVAPLLWGGSKSFRFLRSADDTVGRDSLAVWRTKAAPGAIAELERLGVPLIEVEDGFLRSRGLGADCIPPLSITVDRLGAHFDPSQLSELEILLQDGAFEQPILERARELRRLIVEAGIGKYDRGTAVIARRAEGRRHILVPGQVEDDRAVTAGGCGLVSNLELLARVREQAPDAYILYKPHPDVLAGHRRGAILDRDCLQFADEIVGELPIASLIDMADEVHVNTSLTGFEALLRGRAVTTYGVPFYAGWNLTRDLGPVPLRRTAKRTIDELVAATLLLYPRYLDPVTGLPCPAEVVVARLSVGEARDAGFIVGMRRLQGKFLRRLRSLVQ
jgi:capsular polysaccharide export protein